LKKYLRVISLAVFAIVSIIVFYYFLTDIIGIVYDVRQGKPQLVVHDGAYYFLVGLLMPYIFMAEILAPLYKDKIVKEYVAYFMFGIVIVGLILPWVLSPIMDNYLKDNGYTYCGTLSNSGTKSRFDAWVTDLHLCIPSQAG